MRKPEPKTQDLTPKTRDQPRSIRSLARKIAGFRSRLRLFLQQPLQLGPSLIDQRRGKLPCRLLPFRRQVFHPHIQQRNILLKPAKCFLYTTDTVRRGKHGGILQYRPSLPCPDVRTKFPSGYLPETDPDER